MVAECNAENCLQILALQDERTQTYVTWEAAFKEFIVAGAKEDPYAEVRYFSLVDLARLVPKTHA